MADNVVISAGTGTTIHADEYTHTILGSGKTQLVKLVDGTLNSEAAITVDIGAKANALRVAPASDITDATYIGDIKFGEALPAGTAAIGKLAANTGVDIGDVDVTSISAGDNNIGNVDIVTIPAPLSVVGTGTEAAAMRVTIATDSTGVLSIDDNSSSLTVDWAGTAPPIGAGLEATALRVTLATDSTGVVSVDDNGGVLTVDGTVTANLSATDNAVLDAIAASDASIDGKITACNTGAVVLAAGTAAIGKLTTNTGVDIGDVDVTSIVSGTGATNLGKAEDAAHTSGDVGVMSLVVRKDTAGTLGGTDGDYVPLQVDVDGSLRVSSLIEHVDNAAVIGNPTGVLIIGIDTGGDYAAIITDTSGHLQTDMLSIIPGTGATNLGKAEDAAHTTGDTGVMALSVRQDTAAALSGTDADYQPLITDANGRLHVIASSRAKSVETVTDWTAVAQNTVGESGTIDCSTHDGTTLLIQAFLDTTTAHTGTRFIVQVSSNTTGNEDWHDYREFINLIGTAVKDDIEDNPLAANSTAITLTAHTYTTLAKWLAIEDATLINSELVYEVAQAANSVTILDGTTNEHANTADTYNIAMSKVVILDATVQRARVLIDNTYDSDGSTLNYKVRAVKMTR